MPARQFCRPPAAGTDRRNPLFMRLCTEYAYLPAIAPTGAKETRANGDKRARVDFFTPIPFPPPFRI